MKTRTLHRRNPWPARSLLVLAGIAALWPARAADIDIYAPSSSSGNPNVVFLLDNTSNWSSNNQGWNADDSWLKCPTTPAAAVTACQELIKAIYYPQAIASTKFPWSTGYARNRDNVSLAQGQVQLRALKLVLNRLVCTSGTNKLNLNVGISMLGNAGTVRSPGDPNGFMRFAVQALAGREGELSTSCGKLLADFDTIDIKITDPAYKAPTNANYGAAFYEIFKYYGGHTNPTGASMAPPSAGTPTGASGYGPIRFSRPDSLEDPAAFTSGAKTAYKSPITAASACGNNYIVLVGNGYPKAEPNNDPTSFGTSFLGYTPPSLSAISSDTSRYADEWAQFLANTDVNGDVGGTQRVITYTVNTFKDKPDADQGKLLKSMAAVGGASDGGYFEVNGNLGALVEAFEQVFANIAAVNSVFAATTLPVSTTTQGTFLNQVFVGMFRPDRSASPRWVGNLKQYQFGRGATGALDLVDASAPAISAVGASGFFAPTAKSFWTRSSVYFTNGQAGTPPSSSDAADGAVVEKGGAAQMLREANLQNASARKMFTIDPVLGVVDFSTSNLRLSASTLLGGGGFTLGEINWVRGENNQTSLDGAESFAGSFTNGSGAVATLGATGARHSIHGDVLHSQPVALNYGNGRVIVYYGANDGTLRAVDGQKTTAESSTAGQELWSMVMPEHYDMIKRLRDGTPVLHLPETDKDGLSLAAPAGKAAKGYGMDGPIGVFAAYAVGGASVNEAIIYPTERRGGRNVYAFDVTTAGAKPTLRWKISGGSGSFARLGQTWSKPKPLLLPEAVAAFPVIVMGGGYDAAAEDLGGTTTMGNRVYILNGRDGSLLRELTTEYSVPSDVTLVDTNFDGQVDRGYVADVRGNLYRINMTNSSCVLQKPDAWTIIKIASLAGSSSSKVFFAPDVVATRSFVAVMLGTGDREKPLLVTTKDNFVVIKDTLISQADRSEPLTLAALVKVAEVVNDDKGDSAAIADINTSAASSANGCYLKLATNGEKVVNAPFTIAGATYFGTNRPAPKSASVCAADLGIARVYKFPLFCTAPASPPKLEGGGLPPSPVGGLVTLKVNGKDVLTSFLIGGGKDGSSFKPDEPKPPVSPARKRQSWRIDNANR